MQAFPSGAIQEKSYIMQVMQCPSPACGRPFQLNQFAAHPSRPLERGRIVCPHCSHAFAGDGNSVYLTHALNEHQEATLPRRGNSAGNSA
jgi:hypothetical protein